MSNVSFTGHRQIYGNSVGKVLYETLEELIDEGADMFYAGGASGFDTLAAETVLELRVMYPWISLVLVLPCPPEQQSMMFDDRQKDRYYEILHAADRMEYISDRYTKDCMRERNQRLTDYADICVCYYDERRHATGTGQTVRMAQRKGIRIINLFDEAK